MAEAVPPLSWNALDDSKLDECLERLQRVSSRFNKLSGLAPLRRTPTLADTDACVGPPEVVALPVVAGWLAEARRVVVLTGEGLSRDSGVPTPGQHQNRVSEQALRRSYSNISAGTDPGMPELIPVEVLDSRPATWQEFQEDPAQVWRWHRCHQALCQQARPTQVHRAISELEVLAGGQGFSVVTTAVDGLHERAGTSRHCLYEVNGSIHRVRCDEHVPRACLRHAELDEEDFGPQARAALFPAPEAGESEPGGSWLPSCPRCGVRQRPHVLWAGEARSEALYFGRSAVRAAGRCDVLLVVGASIARDLPSQLVSAAVAREGARVILINSPTRQVPEGVLHLPGGMSEILPALVSMLRAAPRRSPSEGEQVLRAFRSFDANGDGFISRDELAAALARLGRGVQSAWAERILEAADLDHDDRIDYVDFHTWVMECATPSERSRLLFEHLPELKIDAKPKRPAKQPIEGHGKSSSSNFRSCSAGHSQGRFALAPSPARSQWRTSRTPSPGSGRKSPAGEGPRTLLPQIAVNSRGRSGRRA